MKTLILYSKPGCHLCEGLQEKLIQIQEPLGFQLEIRDINTQPDWFELYQYEIPVLFRRAGISDQPDIPIPRPSPRLTAQQLQVFLQPHLT